MPICARLLTAFTHGCPQTVMGTDRSRMYHPLQCNMHSRTDDFSLWPQIHFQRSMRHVLFFQCSGVAQWEIQKEIECMTFLKLLLIMVFIPPNPSSFSCLKCFQPIKMNICSPQSVEDGGSLNMTWPFYWTSHIAKVINEKAHVGYRFVYLLMSSRPLVKHCV